MKAKPLIGPTLRGLRSGQPARLRTERAIAAMHRALCDLDWVGRPDGIARRVHIDFGPPYTPVAKAITAIDPAAACLIICFDLGLPFEGDRMESLIRFVTRANAALLSGNFDVDVDEGTVHFRNGVVFGDAELDPGVVSATLKAAIRVVNAHSDALMRVATGQAEADEAIAAVWSICDEAGDA